jgi:cyanophycinase
MTFKKNLVLAGGGNAEAPWTAELYRTIVNLAGGKNANIGIITAASEPNKAEENGYFYERQFSTYGAKAEWIPIDLTLIENNSDSDLVEKINSMTGFFFGAGDQSRHVSCLRTEDGEDSPMLAAIRHAYECGAVIAGTSAGTVFQSGRPMITDDETYDAQGGFGLFSYGILDTHFTQRGREARLITFARKTGTQRAYGIDENTALVVRNADTPSVSMEVLGEHRVHILDVSSEDTKIIHLRKGEIYTCTRHWAEY